MIRAEIEIAAPPPLVRSILLDFPNIPQWHTAFIHSIVSEDPAKLTGQTMVPGDKIVSNISGMALNQTCQENTETHFRWIGPWKGLLTGVHGFEFHPSKTTPGATTFVQWEEFTGVLAVFMRPGMFGGKRTKVAFDGVNLDLKRRAESLHGHVE